MKYVFLSKNTEDSKLFAKEVLDMFQKEKKEGVATVVFLSGDLGAGKTFLSKQIAGLLGVNSTVQSPTFTLLKRYKTNNSFFREFIHIDLYRIENEREIQILNLKNLYNTPDTLICIEWPEKIQGVLPEHFFQIFITHKNESEREFNIKKV